MSQTDMDPFASNGAPSLSFKDAPLNTVYTMEVTAEATMLQSRDYLTGEPAFWPAGRDGQQNPVMAAVVNGLVDGEERSIWATKPSSMFAAIAQAQKDAGKKIGPGDTLQVAYVGDKPNQDSKKNPAKQYKAKLIPAGPGSTGDAFAQQAPPQQQAPAPAQQAFPPASTPPAAAPSNDPWATAPSVPGSQPPF